MAYSVDAVEAGYNSKGYRFAIGVKQNTGTQESKGGTDGNFPLSNESELTNGTVLAALNAWFEANKIEGIRLENFINNEGKKDRRVVLCDDCEPLWARFYTIDNNEPFFCDRDGKPVKTMAEIGHERRNGYSWYSNEANTTIRRYKKWCKIHGK